MSGQGLAMDAGSNLFFTTGNGQFDTNITPPINYGDAVMRLDLSQGPTVQDYFVPMDEIQRDTGDEDLGAGGVALLPDQSGPNPIGSFKLAKIIPPSFSTGIIWANLTHPVTTSCRHLACVAACSGPLFISMGRFISGWSAM